MTDETKAKISAATKKAMASPEVRAKLSASAMGRYVSPETRAKMSIAQMGNTRCLGHSPSLETRAKISNAKMGIKKSPETRAKMFAARKRQQGHPQSLESRAKKSAAESGPLCWNWKGGITPEQTRVRHSFEYRAWRTAVFERDDYTCQDCGKRGVYLEAHHVHGFAKYPEERFVVDNGKTLCLPCHDKMRMARVGLKQEVEAVE